MKYEICNGKWERLANMLASKARCANMCDKETNGHNRFVYECRGIQQTLETLGVDYEYEFDLDCKISAVIVNGFRANV